MSFQNPPSTDMRAPNQFDNSDVIRVTKFEYDNPMVFRVLGPMIPVSSVWYQAHTTDPNTGEVKQGARMVRLPIDYPELGWSAEPTIFDVLRRIDLQIKQDNLPPARRGDKIRSVWDPNSLYVFPVLDRQTGTPEIKLLEANWTVYNGIKTIQTKAHPVRKTYLHHGLIWMGDIVITKIHKKEGANIAAAKNTTYTVESLTESNKFCGKLEIGFDKDKEKVKDLWTNAVKYGIFTQEEADALRDYSMETVVSRYKPHTNADIMAQLQKAPLALDAVDNFTNTLLLPQWPKYEEALRQAEISYRLLEDASPAAQPHREPVPAATPEPALNPAMEIKPETASKPVSTSTEAVPDWMNQ